MKKPWERNIRFLIGIKGSKLLGKLNKKRIASAVRFLFSFSAEFVLAPCLRLA
jgi:hypothetical protein